MLKKEEMSVSGELGVKWILKHNNHSKAELCHGARTLELLIKKLGKLMSN